jgi:signal transduction histidine kinase
MDAYQPTVLMIGRDEFLLAEVRTTLQVSEPACRFASAASFAAVRSSLSELSPDVIVFEESATLAATYGSAPRTLPLAEVVASLAGFAPVVVLGLQQQPAALSELISAGSADFVPNGENHVAGAATCVAKRLAAVRDSDRQRSGAAAVPPESPPSLDEKFAELLRHELNNPLTGILGNAELLLAEARRQNNFVISEAGLKRLETIAVLAVRMRETVRRLSQACESREELSRSL